MKPNLFLIISFIFASFIPFEAQSKKKPKIESFSQFDAKTLDQDLLTLDKYHALECRKPVELEDSCLDYHPGIFTDRVTDLTSSILSNTDLSFINPLAQNPVRSLINLVTKRMSRDAGITFFNPPAKLTEVKYCETKNTLKDLLAWTIENDLSAIEEILNTNMIPMVGIEARIIRAQEQADQCLNLRDRSTCTNTDLLNLVSSLNIPENLGLFDGLKYGAQLSTIKNYLMQSYDGCSACFSLQDIFINFSNLAQTLNDPDLSLDMLLKPLSAFVTDWIYETENRNMNRLEYDTTQYKCNLNE